MENVVDLTSSAIVLLCITFGRYQQCTCRIYTGLEWKKKLIFFLYYAGIKTLISSYAVEYVHFCLKLRIICRELAKRFLTQSWYAPRKFQLWFSEAWNGILRNHASNAFWIFIYSSFFFRCSTFDIQLVWMSCRQGIYKNASEFKSFAIGWKRWSNHILDLASFWNTVQWFWDEKPVFIKMFQYRIPNSAPFVSLPPDQ